MWPIVGWDPQEMAFDVQIVPQVGQHSNGRGGPLRPPRRGDHPARLPHPVQPSGTDNRKAERGDEPGWDAVKDRMEGRVLKVM